MPPPSLSVTHTKAIKELEKLEAILNGLPSTPIKLQYLISEILLIRICAILETTIAEIAYKVVAGAIYLDGSMPLLIHNSASIAGSRTAMLSLGRSRQKQILKWSRAREIKDSVRFVIDASDNFMLVSNNYGATITEIFTVRNYAAHRNTTSKQKYKVIVRRIYGTGRSMQLGCFLLSSNYVATPNLRRYLVEAKVLINDLTKY